MVAALGFDLGVDDRKRFYGLIAKALSTPKRPLSVQLGEFVEVKLDRAVHEVEGRLDRFEAWKKKLVVRDDILAGEPVFPKSRLAVRQIGEMLRRGATAKEIREDYPYLGDEDIAFAKFFAEAYPRVGRPRASFSSSAVACCAMSKLRSFAEPPPPSQRTVRWSTRRCASRTTGR